MNQLPIFVNLSGRPVVLIGTGEAADAKRRLIEAAGGCVSSETAGARLAFVAIEGDEAATVAGDLRARGLLVNVVDRPALCDFTVPAIIDRSPVIVAVGTGGASATLAKALRERLEALLPARLGTLAAALLAARPRIAARLAAPADRRRFLDRLLAPGGRLDPLAADGDFDAVIDAALGGAGDSASERAEIVVVSSDPDDLTLRQLRLLSRADVIVADVGLPAAVLARARRDAIRLAAPPPARHEGVMVILKWAGA